MERDTKWWLAAIMVVLIVILWRMGDPREDDPTFNPRLDYITDTDTGYATLPTP